VFNTVTGKRIAMLGFAFKKDTGDVRESAAACVARALLAEKADLRVFDPKVKRASMVRAGRGGGGRGAQREAERRRSRPPPPSSRSWTTRAESTRATCPGLDALITTEEDAYTACAGSHAVCILTEWGACTPAACARVCVDRSRAAPSTLPLQTCSRRWTGSACTTPWPRPRSLFDGRNILDHARLRRSASRSTRSGTQFPRRTQRTRALSATRSPREGSRGGEGACDQL